MEQCQNDIRTSRAQKGTGRLLDASEARANWGTSYRYQNQKQESLVWTTIEPRFFFESTLYEVDVR